MIKGRLFIFLTFRWLSILFWSLSGEGVIVTVEVHGIVEIFTAQKSSPRCTTILQGLGAGVIFYRVREMCRTGKSRCSTIFMMNELHLLSPSSGVG